VVGGRAVGGGGGGGGGFGEFCLSLFSYLCFSSFSSLPRFPVVILVCLGIGYWGLVLDRTFWLAFEFFV